MSSISFKLDAFEGPLDLLLHLISKHKLNIYDIEISLLLEQYLEYMNQLDNEDYDSAANFLEMAARLIYIKTCSLLPQPEEAEELKKELEGRIIEYSLCKIAAEKLKNLYAGNDIFVREALKLPVNKAYMRTHDVEMLYDAYIGISAKVKRFKPLKANIFSPIVSKRIVSVTSKIIYVLKKLYKTGSCQINQLYDGMTDKSEKVATFLAILELTKSGRIYLNEDNSEIKFHRKDRNKFDTEVKSDTTISDDDISINEDSSENDSSIDNGIIDNNIVNNDFEAHEYADEDINNDIDVIQADDFPLNDDENKSFAKSKSAIKFSSESLESTKVLSFKSDEKPINEVKSSDNGKVEAIAVSTLIAYAEDLEVDINNSIESQEGMGTDIDFDSTQPPVTVIKPNYWLLKKYYWGNSPVGDDKQGNFWRYGKRT